MVVHSNRGGQSVLLPGIPGPPQTAVGLRGSMDRVASEGDNAVVESFYSLLQKKVFSQRGELAA